MRQIITLKVELPTPTLLIIDPHLPPIVICVTISRDAMHRSISALAVASWGRKGRIRTFEEEIMGTLLPYLMAFSGVVAAVLVVLVIYGNALDTRAENEIYLNKTEEKMMASEQPALASKMNRLAGVITVLAIITGVSLLATAGIWVYIGLYKT